MSRPASDARPRATVIIPTFGHAPFLRHAIASVQAQTVRELEICVILDGSPPEMRAMVENLATDDNRIRVFSFPKAPRTGEIHRAKVIPQTSGGIICYLSHDDVWFPRHVEVMGNELLSAGFTHTLHAIAGLGEAFGEISEVLWADISIPETRNLMLNPEQPCNFFGLSCGAHTRDAYMGLSEGWAVTPEGLPTDLGMWRKFLAAASVRSSSISAVTSLHFPAPSWASGYSADAFSLELGRYQQRFSSGPFIDSLQQQVFKMAVARLVHLDMKLTECMTSAANRERELNRVEMKLVECITSTATKERELIEIETNRRIRELPARKIWKLVWKRLTGQWKPGH